MEISRLDLPGGVTVYVTAVDDPKDRHTVGRRLCETVTGLLLSHAPSGKPVVEGGPEVSISHSGGLAVCAVGPVPLGVDIERERVTSPLLLARARRAGYSGGDFLPWWTALESNCKRLGRGFTWASLPQPSQVHQGTLEHGGERYFYTVCW